MNKKGDFFVSYEMVLSISRIFVLIVFALGMSVLIGSQVDKEVTSRDLEAQEYFNSLITCGTTNHIIDESKLNNLDNCLKTDRYGAEIEFKDKKVIVNKDKFGNLFGLCNTKGFFCQEILYFDGINKLNANILVVKNE
ncbi:MAG: hypothetical protein AABW46_00925 [Nanoarchaeota archaeon]